MPLPDPLTVACQRDAARQAYEENMPPAPEGDLVWQVEQWRTQNFAILAKWQEEKRRADAAEKRVRELEAALKPSDKTISRWVAEFWHECRTGGGWQPDWSEIIRGAFRCARDGVPALATPTEQE
jgi:hypothetical protein